MKKDSTDYLASFWITSFESTRFWGERERESQRRVGLVVHIYFFWLAWFLAYQVFDQRETYNGVWTVKILSHHFWYIAWMPFVWLFLPVGKPGNTSKKAWPEKSAWTEEWLVRTTSPTAHAVNMKGVFSSSVLGLEEKLYTVGHCTCSFLTF